MVAQQVTNGRLRKEQLAHTVAQRAAMSSQHDQVSYLCAQLAHRKRQPEQVCAERDNHFIQEKEEKMLAHMRLLSSKAKNWKSRVVTETEQQLYQENVQAAQHATEVQEAMDEQFQLDGDKLKQNSETCVNPTVLNSNSSSQAARESTGTAIYCARKTALS